MMENIWGKVLWVRGNERSRSRGSERVVYEGKGSMGNKKSWEKVRGGGKVGQGRGGRENFWKWGRVGREVKGGQVVSRGE